MLFRSTPFFNNYRPQFYFRTTDVTGAIELPEGKEMVMPGDNVDHGEADQPDRDGRRSALCDPRGRPYRWRRRRRQDHRVIAAPVSRMMNRLPRALPARGPLF